MVVIYALRDKTKKKKKMTMMGTCLGSGSSSMDDGSYVPQQQASSSMPQAAQKILQDAEMARLEKNRRKREKEKERRLKRKIMDPKFWSKNMDPQVWGNLPHNLTLEIYKKLPFQNFYQLREVCKDWNQVARERRCVTDPIHKPYFVLIQKGDDGLGELDDEELGHEEFDDLVRDLGSDYLHGILTFHIKSGCWQWQKLHTIAINCKPLHKPFSVKGLTLSRDFLESRQKSYAVFDAHTRKRYSIPQQPKLSEKSRALGMAVDTSVVPHTFKVILGSLDIGTQIYDSVTNSWENRSSLLVPCEETKFKTCLHCGNHVYIWSHLDKILVYSLADDEWGTLNPPSRYERDMYDMPLKIGECLGSWQGRIFAVTSDAHGKYLAPLLWVWKLVDQRNQLWEFVAEMPDDMQRWLVPPRLHVYDDVQIFASFCDELVLINSWVPEVSRAYRFVLYNLATKKWEKVAAPNHPVSVYPHSEKDTKRWDAEEPHSMQYDAGFLGAPMMSQRELFARGMLDYLTGSCSWLDDDPYDYPMSEDDDV